MDRVIVVGAGVVGLTCAIRLLEAGHRVDVLARELPRETTSAVAAAIWYPYLVEPRDAVLRWSATTYDVLAAQAASADAERAGVVLRPGTEVFTAPAPEPWWRDAVPAVDRVAPPAGYVDAVRLDVPVVEMPLYLDWLVERLFDLGGSLTRMNLSALPEGPLVVDCAGIGAKHLAGDPTIGPVRGQVVYVEQIGLEEWWLDEDGPTYLVPRSRDIVVGGTEEHGEWSRTPDTATATSILERGIALVPDLARGKVLGGKVGLRPARPGVRLERVGDVVHCYGHGGAGVTTAWGCAEDVVGLVEGSAGSPRHRGEAGGEPGGGAGESRTPNTGITAE